MKNIFLCLAFCLVSQVQAQTDERFYPGNGGQRLRQQGQNIALETCDGSSHTTLNINSVHDIASESKKFVGSCSSDGRAVNLSDRGVLMFNVAKYGDTLNVSKYSENGRLLFQKSTVKTSISRFQQKIIPYKGNGYIATYITYPPRGKTHAVVGYIIYDVRGNEIAQKTVDSLVDASPNAVLLEGATESDFYILQGTHTQCGKYKLHKISMTTKVWTTELKYDLSCENMSLQSFAINNQNTRLGLLFVGTSKAVFNKYFMFDNATGTLIPTAFDISTRVRYNTKTAFGRNNEVYFVRVIDYNTVNAPAPDRSALEILQFDVNQNKQSQKKYFDNPRINTDAIPQLEDVLVANDGTVYITGSRLKKTWLFTSKEAN
jgi:hypothetical protein